MRARLARDDGGGATAGGATEARANGVAAGASGGATWAVCEPIPPGTSVRPRSMIGRSLVPRMPISTDAIPAGGTSIRTT